MQRADARSGILHEFILDLSGSYYVIGERHVGRPEQGVIREMRSDTCVEADPSGQVEAPHQGEVVEAFESNSPGFEVAAEIAEESFHF